MLRSLRIRFLKLFDGNPRSTTNSFAYPASSFCMSAPGLSDEGALALWVAAKSAGQKGDVTTCLPISRQLATSSFWCGHYCLCKLFNEGKLEPNELPAPTSGLSLRHLPGMDAAARKRQQEVVLKTWNTLFRPAGSDLDWNCDDTGFITLTTIKPSASLAGEGMEVAKSRAEGCDDSTKCPSFPPLIVLVGYPGSGKSTFASAFATTHARHVTRVNRDEMRGKGEVMATAMAAWRASKTVVVDMCSLSKAARHEWITASAANNHSTAVWCIFFAFDVGECRERIVRRVGHPTLTTKEEGLRALYGQESALEPPTTAEGFCRLETISTDFAMNALLEEWGCQAIPEADESEMDCGIVKFPRTAHIVNIGAATRDDKILSPAEVSKLVSSSLPVYVTEKVDGANIGFSIAPDGKIRVQNRGHFVDSAYHAQFKPLDKWVAKHMEDLWAVLDGEPGRFILFGEWLYARHSVEYDSLVDYFLAFDVFDTRLGVFLSWDKMTERLSPTGIHHVPLLAHRPLRGMEDLMTILKGKSTYGPGQREGVVVRLCDADTVVLRGKLVCADFLTGLAEGRWNRQGVKPNSLAFAHHA